MSLSTALDTAQLELVNWTNETLYFYRQFVDCFKCPLIRTATLPPNSTAEPVLLKTIYSQVYAISNLSVPYLIDHQSDNCVNFCSNNCNPGSVANLADQGKYRLIVNDIDQRQCQLITLEHGRNNFYSFLIATFLYLTLVCGLYLSVIFARKRLWPCRRESPDGTTEADDSLNISAGSGFGHQALRVGNGIGRFGSIDAFRGLTILLMIFVNYGAGEYHWLQHAPWDGALHLADFVFPFFIFIMGASIAVAFKNLKLFLLGLVVNSIGSADFSTIRIPGVLQRFAISYFVVASVHLLSITIPNLNSTSLFLQKTFRYFPLWPEYLLALVMCSLYSFFTYFWQYDDKCPVGYVGPGGLYDNMFYPYCTGGAAHKIDELIFTPQHCYKGFFASVLYDPGRKWKLWHDPEGLLGTANSIVLTLIGLQVGATLVSNHEPWARFRDWSLMAIVLAAFTKFSILVLSIPVNKNIWSFSFISATGCLATVLFSAFHFLIDHRASHYWQDGWPLHFAGQNALAMYMGHEIARDLFPFTFAVSGTLLTTGGHIGFLLRNLVATTAWLLISVYLAKKQIFITV